jgi:hypothetical protein
MCAIASQFIGQDGARLSGEISRQPAFSGLPFWRENGQHYENSYHYEKPYCSEPALPATASAWKLRAIASSVLCRGLYAH